MLCDTVKEANSVENVVSFHFSLLHFTMVGHTVVLILALAAAVVAATTTNAAAAAVAAAAATSVGPPNVVVFFVDDMGYGDVSCNGNDTLKTPAIDGRFRAKREPTLIARERETHRDPVRTRPSLCFSPRTWDRARDDRRSVFPVDLC